MEEHIYDEQRYNYDKTILAKGLLINITNYQPTAG